MQDKGISSIKYNYLNLPNYLHLNKSGSEDISISTKYRADGTKLNMQDKGISSIKYNYLNLPNYLHLNKSGSEDIS
ncbi:hypothetical protein, partial [Chryseobacterium sp. CH1]|uniref:hypothetical protein n=1 Tax=Chryseobacterium sp. CH1 TaxID=713551 RepID=UPI001025E135